MYMCQKIFNFYRKKDGETLALKRKVPIFASAYRERGHSRNSVDRK